MKRVLIVLLLISSSVFSNEPISKDDADYSVFREDEVRIPLEAGAGMVAGGITLALVAAAIASIPVMPEATADIILDLTITGTHVAIGGAITSTIGLAIGGVEGLLNL